MRTLRLHTELYSASAVESARGAFTDYAAISTERDDAYHVLTVEAPNGEDEAELAAALANYALAATIEERR